MKQISATDLCLSKDKQNPNHMLSICFMIQQVISFLTYSHKINLILIKALEDIIWKIYFINPFASYIKCSYSGCGPRKGGGSWKPDPFR